MRFAREVAESRGHPSNEAFREVRNAGHTDEETIEIISNVALTTFSNYLNETIGTEVDVPEVEPVQR